MDARFVVVWGMHRSGTSLLAAAMKVLGADLSGAALNPDRFNPTGYFESQALVDLNRAMLGELGQKWHSLAPIDTDQEDALVRRGYVDRAVELLRSASATTPLVLLKDPTLCRLGPLWRRAFATLGITPYSVIVWRDPAAVAASLRFRAQQIRHPTPVIDMHYGQLLWLVHTQGALRHTEGYPRILINYNQFLDRPVAHLQEMSRCFHLPLNLDAVSEFCNSFIDKSLNHNTGLASDADLPQEVEELRTTLDRSGYICPSLPTPLWASSGSERVLATLLDDAHRQIRTHAARMASIHADVCVLTGECKRMAMELAAQKRTNPKAASS